MSLFVVAVDFGIQKCLLLEWIFGQFRIPKRLLGVSLFVLEWVFIGVKSVGLFVLELQSVYSE